MEKVRSVRKQEQQEPEAPQCKQHQNSSEKQVCQKRPLLLVQIGLEALTALSHLTVCV